MGLGSIAQALATWYGYKTIGGLVAANFGLIVVLVGFLAVCLVFWKLLNRQFPQAGRRPFAAWVIRTTIVFFICAFVFLCGFTLFYEKQKLEAQSFDLTAFNSISIQSS